VSCYQVYTELNTINSLQFMNADVNLFFSGARDGFIKMWDRRDMRRRARSVADIRAHAAKMNTLSVALDDRQLLSSARDSALALWVTHHRPPTRP
jgi:WD40 repeat protein